MIETSLKERVRQYGASERFLVWMCYMMLHGDKYTKKQRAWKQRVRMANIAG